MKLFLNCYLFIGVDYFLIFLLLFVLVSLLLFLFVLVGCQNFLARFCNKKWGFLNLFVHFDIVR